MKKLMVTMALLAPMSMALAQDAAPAAPAAAAGAGQDRVVLQVGDEKITEKELMAILGPQFASLPPSHKSQIAERVVQIKLLAQEARKRGLENDVRVRVAADQALAQILAEDTAKPDDDATLKAKYDADKSQYEQVKARHILIRGEGSQVPLAPGKKELTDDQAKAKAQEIRDRIVNKKEDFATVAKAESDEPAAKNSGGDLDPFSRGMMTPPFEKVAFAQKDGEISEPVKTDFGWHIIQTQQHKTPSFEEVKAAESQQGGKKINELLTKLKASTPVKKDDAFFNAAPAAMPGMPGMPQMPAGHPAVQGAK